MSLGIAGALLESTASAVQQAKNLGLGIDVVRDFGASGSNASTTGSITSGSNVLTTTSVLADAANGQDISVAGAGASGALLVTTILAGAGTTTLYLVANAGTTVSDAAVTHDDTAAIQSAVTAAAGEDLCLIGQQSDVFIISSPITIPSNSHLVINGTIQLVSGANCDMMDASSAQINITIEGVGILDGNRANQTGTPSGFYVAGSGSTNYADHIRVRNITIQNVLGSPFNGGGLLKDARVIDCQFYNNGEPPQFVGATDCHFESCHLDGSGDAGFTIWGGCVDCSIVDCSSTACTANGIEVLNDTVATSACSDIIIANNHCYGNGANGISVTSNQSPVVLNRNVTVEGNIVHGNNTGNQAGGGGISSTACDVLHLANNIIHDDHGTANNPIGLLLSNTNNGVIRGNTVYDEGQGSTSAIATGMQVSVNCNTLLIEGNQFFDDQAAPTTSTHFIVNSGATGISLKNNQFGPNVGSVTPIANTELLAECTGNVGFNPVGAALPLIPTNPPVSGTVYQNQNPMPVTIYLPAYATTSGTAGSVAVALGSTSTPSALYTDIINSGTSSSVPRTLTLRVPAAWYYSFTATSATLGTASFQGE